VPDVVSRTPPYVDRVLPDSPAEKAGLRPDDLVVIINSQVVSSRREADEAIARLEDDAPLQISILRDDALLEFTLVPSATDEVASDEPGNED
jgi:serine protease Do